MRTKKKNSLRNSENNGTQGETKGMIFVSMGYFDQTQSSFILCGHFGSGT
jgi:hypothetical protein